MWTTAKIRRHILRLAHDKPFSIRDFLVYGSRAAVDQAFRRLVVRGEVIRVARGLYIKYNAPPPTILEVATAKAWAFRKTIVTHGAAAARALKLTIEPGGRVMFAVNGHSSSFRFGNIVIHLVGVSARKTHLADEKAGLAIRALWHLGEKVLDIHLAAAAVSGFLRTERQFFRQNVDLMPDWMYRQFAILGNYYGFTPPPELLVF